jgi:hypothetical protein
MLSSHSKWVRTTGLFGMLWLFPIEATPNEPRVVSEYSKQEAKEATLELVAQSRRELRKISGFAKLFAKEKVEKTCSDLPPERYYDCFKEQLSVFVKRNPVSETGWIFLVSRGVSLIHLTNKPFQARTLASVDQAQLQMQREGLRIQHLQLLDLLLVGLENVNQIRKSLSYSETSKTKQIEWVLRQEQILRFLDTSTSRLDTLLQSLEQIAGNHPQYLQARGRYEAVKKDLPTIEHKQTVDKILKQLEPLLPATHERQAMFRAQNLINEWEISAIVKGIPVVAVMSAPRKNL